MKSCLSICSLLFLLVSNVHAQNDEFVLVKEEDDISIYERWIKFPKSDPAIDAREVKGVFAFKSSINEAVRLLQNDKLIQKWQSHVSEFKVYPTTDSTTWYEYSYHDIPWPVSDQDHFLIYKKAPVRKGVTRMKLSGSWTFEKITSNSVRATYRILSMPLSIPKFLTDPIIRNNMMTTIQEFIVLIEKKS